MNILNYRSSLARNNNGISLIPQCPFASGIQRDYGEDWQRRWRKNRNKIKKEEKKAGKEEGKRSKRKN